MKARVLVPVLVVLFVLFPADGQAQGPPVRFERISVEQGLSQVAIYCIFQDSRGLMWFGTEDGLNRYDGYRFTVYKRDPQDPHSLSANTVRAIDEDPSGALWIGTGGGGLDRFDRATEQFAHFRHDPADPTSLSDNNVVAIFQDSTGALWLGTEGGGLDQLDRATGQFRHYRNDLADDGSLSSDVVAAIGEDAAGALWIGTMDGGLNKLDRATGRFTRYRSDPADPGSLSHDQVTSIRLARDGTLWVGTLGGLDWLDPEAQQFGHIRHDPDQANSLSYDEVYAVYEDAAGALWVGTSSGLNEINLETQRVTRYRNVPHDPHSLSYDDITTIYEDRSGVLWVGTTVGGLNKLDRKARRFTQYRHDADQAGSLGSDTVRTIHVDRAGTVWVGTSGPGGGLDRLVLSGAEGLDRDTQQFIHYQPDPVDAHAAGSSAVLVVYADRENTLWVGTWDGGLNKLVVTPDGSGGVEERFIRYLHDPDDPDSLADNVVWAIYEDSTGALWVGTFFSGLDRFDRASGRFIHYQHDPADPNSLSDNLILSIYEDRAGTLWVGTRDGLNRLNRETGAFTRYYNDVDDPTSLSSSVAAVIYEDRAGALWIGSGDGLNRFDPTTGTAVHYTEKDGLANDSIACILEDEQGNLWISSSKGVSRFDPRTKEFKNYDVRDGLQSDEFNRGACDTSPAGEMFFGGVSGFNAFDPAQVTDNPQAPPVIISDFQILNRPVAIGADSPLQKAIGETEAVTLSYRDHVFSFEFAALDYSIPEKNRYAYRLEGLDPDWNTVDSTRRFVSYANVPAGTYTFRVKGSNNDGVWNEEGTRLKITITPPPWRTWWAYTLYALLAGLAVAGIVRLRTKSLERKHLEQTMRAAQQERERIATLLESRRQLVASISHELRTPVAVVRGQLESAMADGERRAAADPRQGMVVMLQEIDRLQTLLDDLFTLSRLEVDKLALKPAPTEVAAVAAQAVGAVEAPAWQDRKVTVTLEAGEPGLRAMADERRLQQILANLLHNAVRHTPPGGVVIVRLSGRPEAVVIEVQDSGEGIQPDDLPHIWERFYRGQSQAGGGTGLGLALVKELTEAMGGTVAVESTVGEGSCFTITLPRADEEGVEARAV